eukprot:COSAG05_NODE_1798_length_4039_cov_7.678086_3_plen_304_part_00
MASASSDGGGPEPTATRNPLVAVVAVPPSPELPYSPPSSQRPAKQSSQRRRPPPPLPPPLLLRDDEIADTIEVDTAERPLPPGSLQGRAATVLKQVDTDGSGSISYLEFQTWWLRNNLGGLDGEGGSSCGRLQRRFCCNDDAGSALDRVTSAWARHAGVVVRGGGKVEASQAQPQELSLAEFDAVLSEVLSKAQWRELFEPVPAPSYDWHGRLGPLLSVPKGSPTRLSRALYALFAVYPFVFLFFGADGQGIFNKSGCRRGFMDGDGNHELGDCDLDAGAWGGEPRPTRGYYCVACKRWANVP